MQQRRRLEALRPEGAAEVLLCSQDGRLLEGLVTNVFILADAEAERAGLASSASVQPPQCDGAPAAPKPDTAGRKRGLAATPAQQAGPGPQGSVAAPGLSSGRGSHAGFSNIELWTAGMGEGVVWGTLRHRVLQACQQLGIRVREQAPAMASRALWKEAFLTNSLRGLQPVQQVTCDPFNDWGHAPWTLELAAAPGPITRAIQAAVTGATPITDARSLNGRVRAGIITKENPLNRVA